MPSRYLTIAVVASVVLAGVVAAFAQTPVGKNDWPGFHGPRGDNKSLDTNLAKRWPDGGPKLVWTADGIGRGWAGVAVASGRIYTAGTIGGKTAITALDLDGKRIWQVSTASVFKGSWPDSRATPTIVDRRLYHINGRGFAVCLDAATGKRIWSVDTIARFGGRLPRWGVSESLLVVGRRVICTPGGKTAALAALDKDTGKTVWTCSGIDDKPGYTTAALVDHGGLKQVVTIMANFAVGVSLDTGKLLWKYPHKVPWEANCVTPVHVNGKLLLSGTWGRGATLLKLNVSGKRCTVKEVWRTKSLDNEHGGIIVVDGYIYGQADGGHRKRRMECLELKTGRTMWSTPRLAGRRTSTLTFADGMFYVLTDEGQVALVRPNPKRLEVVSSFNLPKGGKNEVWAHMAICSGRLYIRHDKFVYAYDVRRKG